VSTHVRFSPVVPFGAALLLLSLTACSATTGTVGRELLKPQPSSDPYLSGELGGISQRVVVDSRDFTYAVDVGKSPAMFAYTHLSATDFRLGVWELDPEPRSVGDARLNEVRYDVEGLAVSPDGAQIASASRDGFLRVYDRKGKLVREVWTEQPLTTVAWSLDGKLLAVGSAKGRVTVFGTAHFSWLWEMQAHQDEVRALVFDAQGRLLSGGWDKIIAVFTAEPRTVEIRETRVGFQRGEGVAFTTLRASVNEGPAVTFAYDARSNLTTLSTAGAQRAGLEVARIQDTTTTATPAGPTMVRIARDQTLVFKGLRIPHVDVALCDSCVPAGADGVIGQNLLERYQFVFDEGAHETVITAKESEPALEPQQLLALVPQNRLEFPLFVNDFSISRTGERLGVAFGEEKAARNFDIYNREKKGIEEPVRQGNHGASVDAKTGQVLERFVIHQGMVSTAGISPDGKSLATGGWDKKLYVFTSGKQEPVGTATFGWSVRRARFSPDGRYLAVGSWTPQSGYADKDSDPAAVVYDVYYVNPQVIE